MNIICLDTNVLIWGVKEQETKGQEKMVKKAKVFLEHIEKDSQTRILVPAIVLAELLLKVPPEIHNMVCNLFQKSYQVIPFDVKAAAVFAKIWQVKKNDNIIKTLTAEGNTTKNELKTDCLIVATAVSRKAARIYSHDSRILKKFAEDYIEVCEIPSIHIQEKLL